MKLQCLDLGNVLDASGVTGFYGAGYKFHQWLKWIPGFDFSGSTRVFKTVTEPPRQGNSGINSDGSITRECGDWSAVQWFSGNVLNAMGLPNLGIKAHLESGIWQKAEKPFLISVASVADNAIARFKEYRSIAMQLHCTSKDFRAPWGLQVNLSCPNTGEDPRELIKESEEILDILSWVDVPLMPKYSIASAPISAIMELQKNPHCDGICVSNTIPYDWNDIGQRVWGLKESPMKKYGGGGLSGQALKPLVCQYIKDLRLAGFSKPINGGGGILCRQDVDDYFSAGASSVFLGSCAMLRPWRVRGIIDHANLLGWQKHSAKLMSC